MASKAAAEPEGIDDGELSETDTECDTDENQKEVKKEFTVSTYLDLHVYVQAVTELLEEVYELGMLKGKRQEYFSMMSVVLSSRVETAPAHDQAVPSK